ncbi:YnbE family lipoprotein [Microbulbifer thermotolerans]|uniref:YnbE family lipoprotein n=1 Tax=Microbulbifer thermotolerans TaxID=252514 RepID=A0AB35HYB5_MICTH|nr:YnbE family lipoprotein [Microbulbifer thermotolerans]MCX2830968.1 YnbE family lipoprotein [Microbulbifer thermotolerans]MCX2841811.1 YnbE family lipoprotein [Microbulbifer thermotolerans]
MTATRLFSTLLMGAAITAGCTPTVSVQAPSEPITVNLNVKIEHEIRVKVDRELDDLFEDKEGIF